MLETDYLVIGGGMMGSAAARYLAQAGCDVIVSAPEEPGSTVDAALTDPFASHLDEGRITRHFDPDPVWAELARASIDMYRNLEAESGIALFRERPVLYAGSPLHHDVIRSSFEIAKSLPDAEETGLSLLDEAGTRDAYPSLHFGDNPLVLEQKSGAGYINPRHMVRAQLRLVRRAGGVVIPSAAISIDDLGSVKSVTLANGQRILAEKVLIATGAYGNACDLLPQPLALNAKSRTVLLAPVDLNAHPELKRMPSILFDTEDEKGALDTYLLPPIEYPDGQTYIKIGTGEVGQPLKTQEDIQNWFTGGPCEETLARLTPLLQEIVPAIKDQPITTMNCAYCGTETDRPYIDQVDNHLYLCIGGNGKAAKSSNEIGHLASLMMMDKAFPEATPRDAFELKWQ